MTTLLPKVTILTSLYNCEFYLDSYLNHLSHIEGLEQFEILLLHNAPQGREIDIIKKYADRIPFTHIIIAERESLYETWNRGIKEAQGEYVCIWNVDDIRLPYSILQQMNALDKNQDAVLTYGDFYNMYEYGKLSDKLVINPEFNNRKKSTFFRFHHIGCFPMWRKKIHDKIGYFDEQLKLVADLDFQIRLSLSYQLIKTESILGYYLENVPEKLSSNYPLQQQERNLINLRYGIFDYLNWSYAPKVIRKYRLYKIKYGYKYLNINLPRFFILKRVPLFFVSIIRQPRFFLAFIKHGILKK